MGQKVNPVGLRLALNQNWQSRWFSGKDYPKFLAEDISIREHIRKKLVKAGISKVEIERTGDNIQINIFTARPGVVIGRKGQEVENLRSEIEKLTGKQVQIDIKEVKTPEIEALLVAQSVAEQLEARVSFRRAMKKAVSSALRNGALGVKVSCAGRLGGAEMARTEWYRQGRVPLQTLRADIDYGFSLARTKFGAIGVKVWVYKGDVLSSRVKEASPRPTTPRPTRPRPTNKKERKNAAPAKSETPKSPTGQNEGKS